MRSETAFRLGALALGAALVACSAGDSNTSGPGTRAAGGTGGAAGGGAGGGGNAGNAQAGSGGTPVGGGGAGGGTAGNGGSAQAGTGGSASGSGGSGGNGGAGGNDVDAGDGSAGASGASGAGGSGGSGGPAPVYPPAAGAGDINAGIAQLNLYRAAVGESALTLDSASSMGCAGHLAYLIWEQNNKNGGQAMLSHQETDCPTNPNCSTANAQAGMDSDIAWGSNNQSFGQAVDLWINGLYHRRPLLDPGLVKVGAASSGGYNCVDYRAAGNTTAVKLADATHWPADNMTDVPRTFEGFEGPCPTASNPTSVSGTGCASSGFIPSATFYSWGTYQKSAIDAVASATLTDQSANAAVPLLVYYADSVAGHDPAHGYVQDEIALVPQMSLGASTAFRVDVSATVQGQAKDISWTFTTGTRTK